MQGSLFVTGAGGFVGGSFLKQIDPGRWQRVVCLGRTRPAWLPAMAEFVPADIRDTAAYEKALAGCDAVVHLAAVTGKAPANAYFQTNLEGTRALVGACKRAGVNRFLYISTIAAKFTNQHRYYYAQSKRQAEEAVARSGMVYTIARPTMVLGKGSPVLGSLTKLAKMPAIPVFGNGRAQVQPIHVDDLATCLVRILEDGAFAGQTIEIGGPDILTIEELLVKIRGGSGPVVHLPAGLTAWGVGIAESVLLPVLPFTAGQIASFINDGTIAPDARVLCWQKDMRRLDQMLA